jgi:hypothetical protein
VFEGETAGDLSAISDAELDARLQSLAVDLAIGGAKVEASSGGRKRARKMVRGVALTIAGILFATQTGGLTLIISVTGVADMIDAFEEEIAARSLQVQLRQDFERYNDLYERIAAEKASRGSW